MTDAAYLAAVNRIRDRLVLVLAPMGWTVRVRLSDAPHSTVWLAEFTLHIRTPGHPLRDQIVGLTILMPDQHELDRMPPDARIPWWTQYIASRLLDNAADHINDSLPPATV